MRNACCLVIAGTICAGVAGADEVVGPFIHGEIIVKFDMPAPDTGVVEAALGNVEWYVPRHAPHAKGEPGTPHPLSFYRVAKVGPEADVVALSALVSELPGVDWAHVNGAPEPTFTPNDPMFGQLWNHEKINTEGGWDVSLGSHDVIVALVETGVRVTHQDLIDNLWINDDPPNGIDDDGNGFVDDTYGWDFVQNDNGVEDVFGHGTQVTGISCGVINNGIGIAGIGNTRSMQAKWWHQSGSDMSVAESVYYAVDNGAHVLNLSLGCLCTMPATEDACNYAYDNNVAPVAASGNNNANGGYPGAYPNVIAVSGIDKFDNKYSAGNFGPHIDVAAPTPDITTTSHTGDSSYTNSFGGTSAASPHVAGLVGLMLSVDNSLTPDEIRTLLHENAEDFGAPGFDQIFGWGRIDVAATMEAVLAGACPADFNKDGNLDILDFIAYQNAWTAQEAEADCDDNGLYNILDFVCFQNLFQAGCL
jgi:subtilisin family serine protease